MDPNLLVKIISIPCLFVLMFAFGIMPFAIKKCRMNEAFLSYANTFSGGLFFGIGQFHLLNEGVEKLSRYSKIPYPYFLAATGYSLILFLQKVVFGYIVPSAEQNLDTKDKIEGLLSDSEDDEQKPSIVKGAEHSNDKINASSSSIDKSDFIFENPDNPRTSVDPNTLLNEQINKNNNEELTLKKKKLSAFILLLSISIHGLFECLALGIQTVYKKTLFLFIALMIHKWAEAFALGILFVKAKFSKKFFYLIIILFSIVGPVGVGIGIVLAETAGELVEGIFLSISTGTFLYVACSEVIIEEFSTPEKRYIKFGLYLVGCVFAAGLSLLEYFFE